ncbi:MAG: class I SAM-dependent methyltransferase [Thermoplasmata archaeon]
MIGSPRPTRPARSLDLSRYPNVYDAAFSWDRSQEARTYVRVATARMGKPPRSAAELACGTGVLARRWASWGLEAYGLDRSATAITRARELTRGIVPPGHWLRGDLRSFRLPRRVEMAVVPLDSLGYLVEEAGLLSFFRAARRSLAPGGVLAIDLTLHPEGTPPLPVRNAWKVALRPRGDLRVSWRSQGKPWGSPVRQWEVGRVTVHVPGRPSQIFWEAYPHATLNARTLRDLSLKAGGFGEMWVYSDAAHRARSGKMHRVSSLNRVQGPRLVCWGGT